MATTEDIPSPCIAVCQLDAGRNHCLGCFRTVEEIAAWPRLDGEGKRKILATIKARRAETAQNLAPMTSG